MIMPWTPEGSYILLSYCQLFSAGRRTGGDGGAKYVYEFNEKLIFFYSSGL